MARGQPDFGALAPTETIVGISDMGELAARLGSIVTFDRRGNVIFLENFDGSLARTAYWQYGAGGSVNIDNLYSLHGDFSCKMVAAANSFTRLGYNLAYPVLSRMGLEFSWNRVDEGHLDKLNVLLDLNDGVNWWYGEIFWEPATGIWHVANDAGGWEHLVPAVNYSSVVAAFNHVKLVVDFVTKKYVRLIANNLIYDISNIGLTIGWSTVPAFVEVIIQTEADAGGEATNYLDSLIVTQNEP